MLWSRHFEEFSLKMRYMFGVECKAHTDRNHMAFYIWLKFLSVYIQCIVLHRVPQIAILRYAVNIDKFSMDMYFDEVYGFIFALVPEVKIGLVVKFSVISASFLGPGPWLPSTFPVGSENTERRSIGIGNVFVVVLHFRTRITLNERIVFCISLGCLILNVGRMTLFNNFLSMF